MKLWVVFTEKDGVYDCSPLQQLPNKIMEVEVLGKEHRDGGSQGEKGDALMTLWYLNKTASGFIPLPQAKLTPNLWYATDTHRHETPEPLPPTTSPYHGRLRLSAIKETPCCSVSVVQSLFILQIK